MKVKCDHLLDEVEHDIMNYHELSKHRVCVICRSRRLRQITQTSVLIINNYSPKWRWLAMDIYRAAKRRGKYPTLVTDTEVNSCFSTY